MNTTDINEKVLAAFQGEHKEQLEGIRAVLAALERDETSVQPERIDEAFRLAHSLKGGARVCDLRPAETLAHRLENVFEQVRGGNLCLDKDVVKTINVVLDAIEDWMAALDRDENPAAPLEALTAVERLVHGESGSANVRVDTDDVAQRLISAFLSECPQYLAGLREFAAALHDHESEAALDDVEEAYRLAHNLRGSAHAAEIEAIDETGEALELLIGGFRDRATVPDAASREQLKENLDTIEQELNVLAESTGASVLGDHRSRAREGPDSEGSRLQHNPIPVGDTSTPSKAVNRVSSDAAKPMVNPRHVDTVRISTQSLDTLLRTSRQLTTESAGQEQVSRELQELRRQVSQMQRERESIRRVAAASLHRMSTMPEFNRLASYLETVDRGVQSLMRGTRHLCAVQKRNSWLLQSRSRQIQQNVRQARMVPAEAVYQGLRKLVRDLAKEEGKKVEFRVFGFDVRADRMVFQSLKDPLIHMLRNCIVHGLETLDQRTNTGKSDTCQVDLRIETVGNRLTIEVDDDGRGIDSNKIASRAVERGLISEADIAERSRQELEQLIFQPGFSTSDQVTEIAGRGMGLSVVRNAVTRLQGEVAVCQKETAGTRFRISVPMCMSTHRLLIVSAGDNTYAIPLHGIERLLRVNASELETVEGKPIVTFRDRPVPLISLTSVLGLENETLKTNGDTLHIVILKSNLRRLAVSVDSFLAERDLLIEDLDGPAENKAYLGAILLEDGQPALVLNPSEQVERARPATHQAIVEHAEPKTEKRTLRVLVVDDSFTTRTLEKSILEANGYHVGIAVDGADGLKKLKSEPYDLVISDVEMPHMNGFALLEEIKTDSRLSSMPVILVTSRAQREDQEKGLDLGADAYIVKQRFDHQSLLDTIRQVVHV